MDDKMTKTEHEIIEHLVEVFFENGERRICGYCHSQFYNKVLINGEVYYQCVDCGATHKPQLS